MRAATTLRMCLAALLASQPLALQADVSYVQTVTVKAGGPMSAYSSEIKVLNQISADRSRREVLPADEMAADLSVAKVTLVDLGKDAAFELNADTNSYREVGLDELQRNLANIRQRVDAATGGQALPFAVDNCEWSEAKFRSSKTKERERIGGIRARRHILSMEQVCEDPDTGMSCELEWTMEPWVASRVPDHEEVQVFYQDMADRLQMDYLVPQMPGASQMLVGLFPNRWETLLDEMEDIKGYPVRTVMSLKIGGKACINADGVAVAEDDLWSDVGTSAYNEVIKQSGNETGKAVGDATREAMGDSVGGAIGSSAVGAATGELVGGIAGMFKKEKPKKSNARAAAPVPDHVTLYRITAEISDWSRDDVAADRFVVPEGWTRLDSNATQ